MPSNFTENYQLSQWEASDEVLRADFNADNAKIDGALAGLETVKGNCEIVTGSYVGNGKYGQGNPCTLTFDRPPLVVFLDCQIYRSGSDGRTPLLNILFRGETQLVLNGCGTYTYVTWGEKSVSWYSTQKAEYQFNYLNTTYHYIALLG